MLGIDPVSRFLLFLMDTIYLRLPLCVFPSQRKEKRKSVKERNKGRNERRIGGVQGGREDREEERRIIDKYYGKIRRIILSMD